MHCKLLKTLKWYHYMCPIPTLFLWQLLLTAVGGNILAMLMFSNPEDEAFSQKVK